MKKLSVEDEIVLSRMWEAKVNLRTIAKTIGLSVRDTADYIMRLESGAPAPEPEPELVIEAEPEMDIESGIRQLLEEGCTIREMSRILQISRHEVGRRIEKMGAESAVKSTKATHASAMSVNAAEHTAAKIGSARLLKAMLAYYERRAARW